MDNAYFIAPFQDGYIGMAVGFTFFGKNRLEVMNKLIAAAFDNRVPEPQSEDTKKLSTGS